jgi:hypothetical protein
MADKFTYTTVPNTLREFIKGIPDRSRPDKVTVRYLKQINFKSSNDATIIKVLKFIGLLDSTGAPMEAYTQYLNKDKGPVVMAEQIRKAYAALFKLYPTPHTQSDTALQNFFRESTGLAAKTVNLMAATFKVLCEYADFSKESGAASKAGDNTDHKNSASVGTQIHLNIQVLLPSNAQPAEYDAIFDSLSRHLKKLV